MPLRIDQRLERLRARRRELAFWRISELRDVEGWRREGAPIALGAAWPSKDGAVHSPPRRGARRLAARGDALGARRRRREPADARLRQRPRKTFGLDPYHEEFPLAGRRFASPSKRRPPPFGQPVRDPRLNRAAFIRLDLALDRFADSACRRSCGDARRARGAAARRSGRGGAARARLAVATPDYIARIAPRAEPEAIWRLPAVAPPPPALDAAQRASVAAAQAR